MYIIARMFDSERRRGGEFIAQEPEDLDLEEQEAHTSPGKRNIFGRTSSLP
jgi:hypothetical protein